MDYTLLSSEPKFKGKAVKVWVERVRYPDGFVSDVEIVRHPGAVTIVPVDESGAIWFVRQYRHPVGETLLELPAGTLEPDEAPAVTAAREIREEIGMTAKELKELGSFYVSPGYSTENMVVYLATGLSPAPLEQDLGEQIVVEKYPLGAVYAMIDEGKIRDAKTLAAFLIARDFLKEIIQD
jgi:ADP-ribose pyrophosphatase